jgi:hypothetical protein
VLHIAADQFINRPVNDVYERVCSDYFAFQPIWDPAIVQMDPIDSTEIAPGTRARVTRTFRGKTELGESQVLNTVPGLSLTIENRYTKNKEQRLISCHRLNGGGTRLHVEITSEIGFVARLIAPLTVNLLERALALSLREIKLAIENESVPDVDV